MPVLFVGHGSPMNGIESNDFSRYWAKLAAEIPKPTVVLCISAHWLTRGTQVTAMEKPRTIHDFSGFPPSLYSVQYPAPGHPSLAADMVDMVRATNVGLDHDWGLDHGCWTVVRHMYPEADIPIVQMSIDFHKPPRYHYALAQELASLRTKGALIIGSGNMVHNLRMIDWQKFDVPNYGFDWAVEMNEKLKESIIARDHKKLMDYHGYGASARLAIPTPDHYYPLLYTLALQHKNDSVEFFNDQYVAGSLTMTSVKIMNS